MKSSLLKENNVLALTSAVAFVPTIGSEAAANDQVRKTFPQHVKYHNGVIKPNHVSQATMDKQVQDFYNTWKSKYLKQHPKKSDQYYILFGESNHPTASGAATVSEAHGYGMITVAYMSGYDSSAKTYFDGMYRYYKSFPSAGNSRLMAWKQVFRNGDIINESSHTTSATDGDLDVAYSLLLAHEQWGSNGSINYLSEAKAMINAIIQSDVNQKENILKLGDWASDSDSKYGTATRSSDFLMNHLKAFNKATGDAKWKGVTDQTYNIVNQIYNNYSSSTGVMPDFIVENGSSWKPANPYLLEADTDGSYSWNAARTPWRLATDYILTGDNRAKASLDKTNQWIKNKTGGDPNKITSGYDLKGNALNNWTGSHTFIAPLGVNAMIDSSNQQWLNRLWDKTVQSNSWDTYYSDSIKMLSMIVMSGNWWEPLKTDNNIINNSTKLVEKNVTDYNIRLIEKTFLYKSSTNDGLTNDYFTASSSKPQTVKVTHEVIDEQTKEVKWLKINTWLGTMYIKNPAK